MQGLCNDIVNMRRYRFVYFTIYICFRDLLVVPVLFRKIISNIMLYVFIIKDLLAVSRSNMFSIIP
jgi:hypothetical protein